jgi:hypothetical protein
MKPKILLFNILLIVTISGNAQIKVDSNGKVGIGTLEPSSLLNIHGNTQNIEISNTAETEAGILFYNHGYESAQYSKILYNSGNNSLNFYVNNAASRITISSSGNVGFGYTSPGGKIHIGTDGEGAGLIFHSTQPLLSSFRIYRRTNNWAYITRAGDDTKGLRMDQYGGIKLYVANSVDYANFFIVKAKQFKSKCIAVEAPYYDSTTFEVHGNGEVWCLNLHEESDAKIKKDISEIDSPLEKVMKLRGISYRYKKSETIIQPVNPVDPDLDSLREYFLETDTTKYISEEVRQKIIEEQDRKCLGLIAQEVEEFVPEAVRTAPNGYKSISYSNLVGLLIEAMKEQQKIIDSLANDISSIRSVNSGTIKSAIVTGENPTKQMDLPVLYQNLPNPFDENSEIRFYIPYKVIDAKLYLYNLQGFQIRSIFIIQRGEGFEIIHGSDLQPGIYLYTLIVDGREVDTKRMILTD